MQHFFMAKLLMILSGVWRIKMDSLSKQQRNLYVLYSVFMQTYFTAFIVALYIGLIPVWRQNLARTAEAVGIIVFCTIILLKIFLCQRKGVLKIMKEAVDFEKSTDHLDEASLKIYKSNASYNNAVCLALFVSSSMVGVTLVACKLANYIFQVNKVALELRNVTLIEKPLPYTIWRPVDSNQHYISAFALDTVTASIGCTFNTVTQIIYVSLMTFIIGQLRMLQTKFGNYGAVYSQENNFEKRFDILRNLILEHKRIISFVQELDDNMKYLLLIEFSLNSFQLSTELFQFIVFKLDVMVVFRMTWSICMLLQIFVLSWHANEIQLHGIGISQAVYECNWYDISEKVKRCLLIVMMRAQRPLKISVGPFFVLTNSTGVTTVKAAYSYLAILNNRRVH